MFKLHSEFQLLLSFLLENGIFHYGLSTRMEEATFECLQCHRCTRPIQSGLLWRDGGILHVAYYDGYIRVGVIVEQYEDMLLVQRLSASKNNVNLLLDVITAEIQRLFDYQDTAKSKRTAMVAKMDTLKCKVGQVLLDAQIVKENRNLRGELFMQVSNIIESMSGCNDPVKDMRLILSQHIFEHRAEKNDHFTHFLFDDAQREPTLYCLSGLTTLAVYPRKGKRVASISLDSQYDTRLTAACLMNGVDGVYVTDNKEVFPIYFYRPPRVIVKASYAFNHLQRYFMKSNAWRIPQGLINAESFFWLLLLNGYSFTAFFLKNPFSYRRFSSLMAHPFSHGPVNDLKILPTEDTYLALHCSDVEVVVSERDTGLSPDRWHRVTYHSGGALCLASTPFSLGHRGAFAIAGSKTYVRIKALHYTEDNMVGLHDLGQSRFTDENGKDIEVLNVSLDPAMECRPFPCKLRYSVGYADKAIRTYVALLTGQHEFTVSEKFVAQIEPLHCVSLMICFHGRPMGCYASNGKTLQVWNDLDRHQQKKMKSERMELRKMEVSITSMVRVVGKSCYLVLGYKDSRVQLFEERGKGTGKLDSVGWIDDCHPASDLRPVTVLRVRAEPFSTGDRLFIFSLTESSIFIHSVLVYHSSLSHMLIYCVLRFSPSSFYIILHLRPFEFAVFGCGITMHKLTVDERKRLEKYRDFEF
uniref:Protein MIS12 homolog n=1 Tax=Angiostrongylus cantonensis TaxID=6313 RepID=A0A158PAI8_ANGCA